MSYKIIILGGGMVGSAIARDLKETGYTVSVADIDTGVQQFVESFDIDYLNLNFSDSRAVGKSVNNFDLVIGAVPGFMGFDILKTVLESKKNIVDISFMQENSRDLFAVAQKNGVIAITDAGVAPGLSNLVFGKKLSEYDRLDTAKCYVGGLPQNPQPPWFYKSVFSPIDVIEEYIRPARIVDKGHKVSKPAMTDLESIEFNNIGMLNAFNSDGLRSLLDMPIPNMVEKTLRFPGHIQKIISIRDKGLFEIDKIEKTAKSLIKDWKSDEGDYDQTIMKLEFIGIINGERISKIYNLVDYYDQENHISSMARTTGYTCTAVANILLENRFTKTGVYNLETLGSDDEIVQNIMQYLAQRNVQFDKKI